MSTTIRELTVVGQPAPPARSEEWYRAAKRARMLSWLSLAWMGTEGIVGIATGILAGSIALTGFGINAFIEGFASVVIVWRFTGSRMYSQTAEARAHRIVAVQFFILAPYVGVESVRALVNGERPEETLVGILLAFGSVVFMPMLGIAKQRLADQLGSAATRGEGRQNMLCAYLAGALLLGLLGNALFGAWWLDPAVGLLIAAVALKEGAEAWRGDGCCVTAPMVPFDETARGDDCCD